VAVDDAGNAAVAFVRGQMRQELLVARARSGGRFGPPVVVARSLGTFYPLAATAGGTTTALVWQTPFSGEDERVHVVIARGAGHFTTPATPSAPALQPNLGYAPHDPAVAVDRAGDVLLAYTYSYGGAVHATLRPAGSSRFGPLHVISKLGEGGTPSVALLSDRRPLVIYHGRRRELLATTRLTGPSPDLTPPRVDIRFPPDARNELRRTNAVTVTVRCSQPCMLQPRASLHSHDGTTRADGVQRKLLRPRVTFTERFTFDPDRRAGRPRSGARVRVTIEAQNASGAARQAVKQLKL
jgi:hypothetical protein